jgi:uncharacterized protein
MQYEWDENKRRRNITKHGIDFVDISSFRWETSLETIDNRLDYGEERINAIGFPGIRLVVVTYTERQDTIRLISLRKTSKKEERFYNDYC